MQHRRSADVDSSQRTCRYSIVKADSLNAAVDVAKACPVVHSGGKITVYEIHPAM